MELVSLSYFLYDFWRNILIALTSWNIEQYA